MILPVGLDRRRAWESSVDFSIRMVNTKTNGGRAQRGCQWPSKRSQQHCYRPRESI